MKINTLLRHPKYWRLKLWHVGLVIIAMVAIAVNLVFKVNPDIFNAAKQKEKFVLHMRTEIRNHIAEHINKNEFVPEIQIEDHGELKKLKVEYTIDEDFQNDAKKLLKAYKPDYAAVVAMDASSGKILAMTSFEKGGDETINLSNKATYPAASVFKIVPASAALDKYNLDPDTIVHFNGGNHTL